MIDRDVAGWLLEVLARTQLAAMDPDVVRVAGLAARAREQLSAIAASQDD